MPEWLAAGRWLPQRDYRTGSLPLKCAPVGAWNSFKGQDQDHARALLVPGPMASAARSGQFWQALSLALSAQASHRRTSCLQEIRMRSSPPCVEVEPPKLVQQR